jgi:hypothetical protein
MFVDSAAKCSARLSPTARHPLPANENNSHALAGAHIRRLADTPAPDKGALQLTAIPDKLASLTHTPLPALRRPEVTEVFHMIAVPRPNSPEFIVKIYTPISRVYLGEAQDDSRLSEATSICPIGQIDVASFGHTKTEPRRTGQRWQGPKLPLKIGMTAAKGG